MAKGYNQKLKLLYLVDILKRQTDEEHPMSAGALIEELEKSGVSAERKSIYDDIACLQDYGLDIILNPSKRNGGYYLASRDFELPELKILVDTVQSSRFITAKKSKDLIKKLENLASIYDEKELKRQVYVINRVKTDNESIYYAVNDIYHAIQNNKQISFVYTVWNAKKKKVPRKDGELYVVSPWTLAYNDGNYYLIAYDAKTDNIKHYRVDKMTSLKELPEARKGNDRFADFQLVSYLNMTFNMYAGREENVELEMPESLVGVFIDRFGDGITVYDLGNGNVRVRVKIAVSSQFFGWMAGLGPSVTLHSPENVRKEYKEYIKRILDSID